MAFRCFFLLLLAFPHHAAGQLINNNYLVEGPECYVAACVPEDTTTERLYTEDGVEYVRTPEDAFAGLAELGYPWEPNYAVVDGLRMHYVDVGPADANETLLLLHGQPTWSFLYRKMIPVFEARGYRVIAPDLMGMGKSDKPTRITEHTYMKQIDRVKAFIAQVVPEALETPTITAFVQDWGSLIGLRVIGDEPDWFKRVVVANGILPVLPAFTNPFSVPNPVNYNCSDNRSALGMAIDRFGNTPCGLDGTCFSVWIEYAIASPSFIISDLVDLALSINVSAAVLAGYDAPFPDFVYRAGPRTYPSMMAGIREPSFGNKRAWDSLQEFPRPFLALAGEDDFNLGSIETQSNFYLNVEGAQIHDFEHRRYANAGHFIQEDAGAIVAEYTADFIDGTTDLIDPSADFCDTPGPPWVKYFLCCVLGIAC